MVHLFFCCWCCGCRWQLVCFFKRGWNVVLLYSPHDEFTVTVTLVLSEVYIYIYVPTYEYVVGLYIMTSYREQGRGMLKYSTDRGKREHCLKCTSLHSGCMVVDKWQLMECSQIVSRVSSFDAMMDESSVIREVASKTPTTQMPDTTFLETGTSFTEARHK